MARKRRSLSREEILAAIRECAATLKRNPSLRDLERTKRLRWWNIKACFGGMDAAFRAAGLEPIGAGYRPPLDRLLLDWASVARKQKKLPSKTCYARQGRYSTGPFITGFGNWLSVPAAFYRFAQERGIESQWRDVLKSILENKPQLRGRRPVLHANLKLDRRKIRLDRPVYGAPLLCPGTAHEPTGETGVIYLFGALAQRLGFVMLRMQTGFPDCEAMREVGSGHWQRVRIEFEFSSSSFRKHGHRTDDCDMIVCWIHDWPSCPGNLEVLELRKIVKQL